MKKAYYSYLNQHSISDILYNISEMSYSEKIKIIKKLLHLYTPSIINLALEDYKTNYIQNNRVNLITIFFILKGICKKFKSLNL